MALFRYTAFNTRGREEKGMINAPSAASAKKTLKSKGLYVRELKEDLEKRDRELFPFLTKLLYRVPRRDVGLFARQLGTLLDAGLPLDRSLENIVEQTENQILKKALLEIKSDVVEGAALSDSLKKHPAVFQPIYHNLISVGEKTGAYEQALLRLADLEDANIKMKNKVSTAMFYPLIMLFLLGAILVFLLAVVFPQIQALFVQMDAELPLITKIVLAVSNVVSSWKIIFPFLIGGAGYYFFKQWKDTPEGQEKYEKFLLSQPILGGLLKKIILARFTRNLGVMLQSRVPLLISLQVVARVVSHKIFEAEINRAADRIKEGTGLTDAFRDSTIMSQMVLGMLSAGEISDQVPQMVHKVADMLENDVDSSIQKMSTLLEPAMMVIMGGVIVIIMAAILLPMYNLTKQMQM